MSVTNAGVRPDHPRSDAQDSFPQAVLFDLLTALLDSWTVWNAAAGSEPQGRAWRGVPAPHLWLRRLSALRAIGGRGRRGGRPARFRACRAGGELGLLPAWDGARELLAALRPHSRLGVVTNCSRALGHRAAALLGVDWDVVVTSEEAGYYKPDPRPYQLALARLDVQPGCAAFVAGSGYDLFGTSRVGLRTYWHNRVGLALPPGAPEPERQSPGLAEALPWLARFGA